MKIPPNVGYIAGASSLAGGATAGLGGAMGTDKNRTPLVAGGAAGMVAGGAGVLKFAPRATIGGFTNLAVLTGVMAAGLVGAYLLQ